MKTKINFKQKKNYLLKSDQSQNLNPQERRFPKKRSIKKEENRPKHLVIF